MCRGKFAPFFQEPCYSVSNKCKSFGDIKLPKEKITAPEERIIANVLAKSGYFGGNPETIMNAQGDLVIDAFHYEMFTRDYENTLNELNRPQVKK